MYHSNVSFRACDPKTLNLADGVTWKSKKSRNSVIFKFYCPINNGYSMVRKQNQFFLTNFSSFLGDSKKNKMQKR